MKKVADTPLHEEARKYKSAEEFIEKTPNKFFGSKIKGTLYHGTHEGFTLDWSTVFI